MFEYLLINLSTWGINAKHEWSVWEGVEGITVISRLAGVSRTVSGPGPSINPKVVL